MTYVKTYLSTLKTHVVNLKRDVKDLSRDLQRLEVCGKLRSKTLYYVTVIKTSKVDPFTIYKSRTTIIYGIFGKIKQVALYYHAIFWGALWKCPS